HLQQQDQGAGSGQADVQDLSRRRGGGLAGGADVQRAGRHQLRRRQAVRRRYECAPHPRRRYEDEGGLDARAEGRRGAEGEVTELTTESQRTQRRQKKSLAATRSGALRCASRLNDPLALSSAFSVLSVTLWLAPAVTWKRAET